ncbi:MAG: ATP-binding cassette domain-containing protein [Candidatus Dojkabacteria bacterium]|nr:ATP-binding cassette domain-containing protein [Candidatus Dojkabacteria bacterium]
MGKITVSVKNLSKKFDKFLAVDSINFDAKEGEIFGLLGPNGAGKTTTLRIISSILQPTGGKAEVCGFDVVKNSHKVRENIGILTTEIGVYDRFTGNENLNYFGELYGLTKDKIRSRLEELTQLLEMGDFIDRKAGNYSTGMKQKLAIARSIIHDPKVVILDEPTTGLDVLASITVVDFMRKEKEAGKTVILSTHRMPDAEKLCDRVAIMYKGKIIKIDTVRGLFGETGTSDLEEAFLKMINQK